MPPSYTFFFAVKSDVCNRQNTKSVVAKMTTTIYESNSPVLLPFQIKTTLRARAIAATTTTIATAAPMTTTTMTVEVVRAVTILNRSGVYDIIDKAKHTKFHMLMAFEFNFRYLPHTVSFL